MLHCPPHRLKDMKLGCLSPQEAFLNVGLIVFVNPLSSSAIESPTGNTLRVISLSRGRAFLLKACGAVAGGALPATGTHPMTHRVT